MAQPAPALSESAVASLRPVAQALTEAGCCGPCVLRYIQQTKPEQLLDAKQTLRTLYGIEFEFKKVCCACLGILPSFFEASFQENLVRTVQTAGYECEDVVLAITTPLALGLRHHSLMVFLEENFGELVGKSKVVTDVQPVKEVAKVMLHSLVPAWLQIPYNSRSPFRITMTFDHKETELSLDLLQRLGHKRARTNKNRETAVSAPMLTSVLSSVDRDEFKRVVACPPDPPAQPCTLLPLTCSADSIFLAGRYCKYCRELSQTPWILDGERHTELSVQELLEGPILARVKADEARFSSAGREDVDVRMLGSGRPFIFELVNPRRRRLPAALLAEMEAAVNASTTRVAMRDLQQIERDETAILKDGEETKTKTYSCVVWTERDYSSQPDELARLLAVKDLVLKQKTPLRVMHRRVLAVRDKMIHNIKFEILKPHFLRLWLSTQAGTYVKEFIHGDFGRTQPNLTVLLSCAADILTLDVEAINMPWPPAVAAAAEAQDASSGEAAGTTASS